MRSAASWVGLVLSWVVIGAVAIVLVVAVLIPRVAGATPYTILTGSMRPSLPPGTLVVVKPTAEDQIRQGDVITYQLESGKPSVVTHRVKSVRQSLNGETTFITQGDANDAADPEPVRPVQVRGTVWYSVPYLGHVNNSLNGQQRQVAVYVVVGGLLAYATYMFTSSIRDSQRSRKSSQSSKEEVDI